MRTLCSVTGLATVLSLFGCRDGDHDTFSTGSDSVGATSSITCSPADGGDLIYSDRTAAAVDGCQRLVGSIVLRERLTSDTSALSNLETVEGSLVGPGYRKTPFHVDGLEALREVQGSIVFFRDDVRSLRGLSGLSRVGGSLRIRGVPGLTSLAGLQSLEAVGSLELTDNPVLSELKLNSIKVVEGDVIIRNNPSLPTSAVQTLLVDVTVHGRILVN